MCSGGYNLKVQTGLYHVLLYLKKFSGKSDFNSCKVWSPLHQIRNSAVFLRKSTTIRSCLFRIVHWRLFQEIRQFLTVCEHQQTLDLTMMSNCKFLKLNPRTDHVWSKWKLNDEAPEEKIKLITWVLWLGSTYRKTLCHSFRKLQ